MPATILPQWTRTGTCQPQACGSACCRFLNLEVNPVYLDQPDLARWLALHGLTLTRLGDRVLARIEIPCSMLADDGRCELYGDPARPSLCSEFPLAPASLLGVDDVCTYRFVEGGHDGDGERAASV